MQKEAIPMPKAVIFFAPGLEECEGLVTVDLLRRAGVDVTIAAVSEKRKITGSHDVTVKCDALAEDVDLSGMDAVILPGGGRGTENLYRSALVCRAAKQFADAGKLVAAICAAPTVLGRIGLLSDKRATCYPGCEDQLFCAKYVDAETVTDGNIITASGLGAAIPFALAIIAYLLGQDEAERIRGKIVYRH